MEQAAESIKKPNREVVMCVEAAFYLYHLEWPEKDIKAWQFPFSELKHVLQYKDKPGVVNAAIEAAFSPTNDAPWNVLLRHALKKILQS